MMRAQKVKVEFADVENVQYRIDKKDEEIRELKQQIRAKVCCMCVCVSSALLKHALILIC